MTTKKIRELIANGQEYLVSADDMKMFMENEESRKNEFDLSGIKSLYTAVCYEAVAEYKKIRRDIGRGINVTAAEREKKELESFFGSDFFRNVAKCDSKERVIRAIEDHLRRKAQLKMVK